MKTHRRWQPRLWASKKPFGIGEKRPNNYAEIWRAVRENRGQLRYAWRILRHGVCDGCALGTKGMRDWTLPEIHLCNVRLRLLRLNTMPALDPDVLRDVEGLRRRSSAELRDLGRLPAPMLRRSGEPGFSPISWDDALDLVSERVRTAGPDRVGYYLTSRGQPNENYYAAQKAVRAMGSNSIDNAARVCHSPSTFGLKEALGVAASTCSYSDWIGSDLVVFIGSNVANNQPVAMKYLYHAKKEGTRVAVINTYREPGMERYWVPSNVESALFGTRIADQFFLIDTGGDVAFLSGALKHQIAEGLMDERFIRDHTMGFDALRQRLEAMSWEELERGSGAARAEMQQFGSMVGEARSAVFVWSMGVTQHVSGEDNVRAIINLALSRGFVGRDKCGLMPIRGHSGVQGGAEMGAYSTVFPGGHPINADNARALEEAWRFAVPTTRGLTAPEMIDAAGQGELDVLFSSGGNFLEVLPDPARTERALAATPMRVHMDIVLSSQMLVAPADTVVLLPAATRYEVPGGVTETSAERRVIFSPEIAGPRPPQARPEWEVFCELAVRVRPDLADRVRFDGTDAIRAEIARLIPDYAGIDALKREGDSFQYGGPLLCAGWNFPTADGKAHFTALSLPHREVLAEGQFRLSTRRGKQFNSMVQQRRDPLNRADREAVLMNPADARRLGLAAGEQVVLRSPTGALVCEVLLAEVTPGNLQVHWPEGEVLIDPERRSGQAGIPDYNAVVSVERSKSAVDV
jgi:molybdopterin-dependent oxidoreductase alpha subunit